MTAINRSEPVGTDIEHAAPVAHFARDAVAVAIKRGPVARLSHVDRGGAGRARGPAVRVVDAGTCRRCGRGCRRRRGGLGQGGQRNSHCDCSGHEQSTKHVREPPVSETAVVAVDYRANTVKRSPSKRRLSSVRLSRGPDSARLHVGSDRARRRDDDSAALTQIGDLARRSSPPDSPACCSPRRAAPPTSTPRWPRRPHPASSCRPVSRWPFRAVRSSRRRPRGNFRRRPAGSSGWAWAPRSAPMSCGGTAWRSSVRVRVCATTCSPSRRASRRSAPGRSITTASSTTSTSSPRSGAPGPIDAPDPKVDIAAVNPWMLRMAGEVADGVHVHPLGEPGYIARHVAAEHR